jgi:DNA polymerase-1
MIVLIDADSLVYSCAYGVETEVEAIAKFDENLMYIVNSIEEYYVVDFYYVYHGTKGRNFRYDVDSTYKANRKGDRPEFYKALSNYVKQEYEAIQAEGEEVDDKIAKDWRYLTEKGHEVCIVSIDKDYLQLPALIYNYGIHKRGFTRVTEESAKYNFWYQVLVGDSADNVKGAPGIGPKKAEKLLGGVCGDFSYLRRVASTYMEKCPENGLKRLRDTISLLKLG